MWLPSRNGAVCFDTLRMDYRVYNTRPGDANSLAGDVVKCFYKDRTGILWIGTNDGGVSRFTPNKAKFFGMSQQHDGVPGIFAKAVIKFAEAPGGDIWMATNASGINIYSPATQSVVRVDKITGTPFRTESYIMALLIADSVAFCGHDNGVDVVSARTHRILFAPLRQSGCAIKSIYKAPDGRIWAGGRKGLYLYDARRRTFSLYNLPVAATYVQDIIGDTNGDIWVGLAPGLVRFNRSTGAYYDYSKKYPDLIGSSSSIGAFSRDGAGTLWLGSGERGLIRYNAGKDSFTLWSAASDLPNGVVYATIADAQNNIWASTNNGPACIPRLPISKSDFAAVYDTVTKQTRFAIFGDVSTDGWGEASLKLVQEFGLANKANDGRGGGWSSSARFLYIIFGHNNPLRWHSYDQIQSEGARLLAQYGGQPFIDKLLTMAG